MKFLLTEYNSFETAIVKSVLNYEDFSFTKKRGWLSIHYKSIGTIFSFYRKKTSVLDDHGKWVDQVSYKVKSNDREEEFSDWHQVEGAFESILHELEINS